jgi:hypothetical protein
MTELLIKPQGNIAHAQAVLLKRCVQNRQKH